MKALSRKGSHFSPCGRHSAESCMMPACKRLAAKCRHVLRAEEHPWISLDVLTNATILRRQDDSYDESKPMFSRKGQRAASVTILSIAGAIVFSFLVIANYATEESVARIWLQRKRVMFAFRDLISDSSERDVPKSVAVIPDDKQRVRVWSPHSYACRGNFVFRKSEGVGAEAPAPPSLMLREAAVDFRQNSLRDFTIKHHLGEVPFRRLTLQVSAARGMEAVQPVSAMEREEVDKAFPSAFITTNNGNEQAEGWRSEIDYIQGDPPCVNKCFYPNFEKQICAGQEWQVIVTIVGPSHIETDSQLESALNELASSPGSASLEVNLPLRYSPASDVSPGKLSLSLSCISGLLSNAAGVSSLQVLLPLMPSREASCAKSIGSVVVSGGAMFGYKRNSVIGRKEAAHFAARSLMGSVRFDTVAVSVIANFSVSEIQAKCGDDDPECVTAYHESNDRFMSQLAEEVEEELRVIGVPQRYWARIILVPVCRLGTDFDGFEANGHGCRWSAHYGQWVVNELSYTLFSPYHKWYASFDLDEFLVHEAAYLASRSTPHRRVAPISAADLFDERERESATPGVLRMPWLEFKILRDQATLVTKAVLESGGLEMVSTANGTAEALDRSSCLQSPEKGGGGGKPVLSCSNGGIGIHVHDSLSLTKADDMRSRVCNARLKFDTKLALYHGHGPRFGDCTFPRP